MKVYPNRLKTLNLLKIVCIIILIVSCSDDDHNLPNYLESGEITISSTTTDTIVYVISNNDKVPIYLSFPKDCNIESYPAVVVMHGSDGMWKNHDPDTGTMSGQNSEWRILFDENCIVGAYVDSFSGRGVTTRTGKWATAPDNFKISSQFIRSRDANAALALLKKLKFSDGTPVVRSSNIGLLGFSDGASAVASTLYNTETTPVDWKWTQNFDGKTYDTSSGILPPEPKPTEGFAGGIFYYGGSVGYDYWGTTPCSPNAPDGNIYQNYAPMLYQIPVEGYLTENTLCLVDVLKEKGAPVELNLYDGVGHGFDFDHNAQSSQARINAINWFKEILNMN